MCIDDQEGVRIVCEPRPDEGLCGEGRSCSADAICEDDALLECEYDGGTNYRACGECGWEFCLPSGVWSGACSPNEATCGEGITALKTYRQAMDKATGEPKGRPVHDWASNGADAIGYLFRGLLEGVGKVHRPKPDTSWVT